MVRGTGKHARELRSPDAIGQGTRLSLELGKNGLVVFPGGELEQLDGVTDVLRQRAQELDLLDEPGAFPQDRLGLRLVVPKIRFARQLVELAYLTLECRDVKDAPLAHRRAV
jgi:hypothetical protein